MFQVQGEEAADRSLANLTYSGARLPKRRDERQDHPARKGMESEVCQAHCREKYTQSAVSCIERGSR